MNSSTLITLLFSFGLSLQAGQPAKTLINPVFEGALTGSNVTLLNLGLQNEITPGITQPAIVGGALNFIDGPDSDYSSIFGGSGNTICANTQSSFIGGGDWNIVSGGAGSAIIGGYYNETYGDDANFIGGGFHNLISVNCGSSAILVGDTCKIDGVPGSDYNLILGGLENATVAPGRFFMNILGGRANVVSASEAWAIGMGVTNTTPKSVEIGLNNSAKVRVTPKGLLILGMPLILQDTNGVTYTKIYTQGGQVYGEPCTP